jgi:hypothetical protein
MGAQRDGELCLATARLPNRAGWVEHACELLCALGLVVMIVLIAAGVLCRSLFGFSLQITDELGGYLLVAICSSVCPYPRLTTRSTMWSSCRLGCRRATS